MNPFVDACLLFAPMMQSREKEPIIVAEPLERSPH